MIGIGARANHPVDEASVPPQDMDEKLFRWSGTGPIGNFQRGIIRAPDINAARQKIETQGVDIAAISQEQQKKGLQRLRISERALPTKISVFGHKVNPRSSALFTCQLATLIEAGIPILQSLEVLAEDSTSDQKVMAKIAKNLGEKILAGNTLAEAASNFPLVFESLTQQLIKAGEATATLDATLHNIANHQERTLELKAKIKKALVHPIAVLTIAAVVTALMLTKVVPQFEQMFRSQGKTLPAMTTFVIELSTYMQNYWPHALATACAITIVFKIIYRRQPAFTLFIHRLLLNLPLCGKVITANCVARFSRTLATTYSAGIPIADALTFAGPVTGNLVYQHATQQIQHSVAHGESLHAAIAQVGCFPTLIIKMIAIGEQAGVLDTMLEKSAVHYEREVANTIEKLLPLLEPAMMALLGLILGGLITAMYLPVFQMGSVLGG